jgi:hypothetical protein
MSTVGRGRRTAPSALTFVDQDRLVHFVDVQADYTALTEVADIIAALTDLAQDGERIY